MLLKSVFGIGFNTKEDKELHFFIKNNFGYYPKKYSLYKLAMRHPSHSVWMHNGQKINNERLEYLGDAVLSTIAADYLFKMYPMKDEGFLTEMRARMVNRNQLNKLSNKLGINSLINIDNKSPKYHRFATGNAFEALIGAMYLDKGYKFTHKVITNRVFELYFDMPDLKKNNDNYKSQIIEWAQKEKRKFEFISDREEEQNGKKQFFVDLLIDDECLGKGCDNSVKGAEQNAAMKALVKLDIISL